MLKLSGRPGLQMLDQSRGSLPLTFYRPGSAAGLEEIDDGIWNVYFGPLTLGRLHERHMRIEDECG
jgi:hypothetical protein